MRKRDEDPLLHLAKAVAEGTAVDWARELAAQPELRPELEQLRALEAMAALPRNAVPDPLQTIEAQAEDIIDVTPAGDWTTIATDVEDISAAWKTYLASDAGASAPTVSSEALTQALAALETSSAAEDAQRTMQASNDVSAAVVDLFALYDPVVPADIGRMDVLGRQVILDVSDSDLPAATRSVTRYAAVWNSVRSRVIEHGGEAEAGDLDASVERMRHALNAGDAKALIAEVRINLELVDALERVFD